MADQKQSQEFLGGGPKFNSVGRDNRSAPGAEEPVVAVAQTGYWLRVAAVGIVILLLAGLLFFLNAQSPGRTTVAPLRRPGDVSPDAKTAVPADPNFK